MDGKHELALRHLSPGPEFIDPRFRENKPKTLVFSNRKRAFWACFREHCVYNFGHGTVLGPLLLRYRSDFGIGTNFHTGLA
jgi:hypothetical protein